MADLKVKARLPYAVELECSEPETRHWRHPWCLDENKGELALTPELVPAGVEGTISTCFDEAVKRYSQDPCMGSRPIMNCTYEGKKMFWKKGPYEWKTFAEVHADVVSAAKALLGLPGIQELRKAGKCVAGILADTSAEWQMSAQAAFQVGIPVTTVYTTLGHEAMVHGLNETECSVLFLDWTQYDVLLQPVLSKCTSLQHIVLIGKCFVPVVVEGGASKPFPTAEEVVALPKVGRAVTTTFENLVAAGKVSSADLKEFAPKADTLAFIMYTSGSTGMPKGVMLSHKNFVSVVAGIMAQGVLKPNKEDWYIAYLPLAHILELIVETTMMVSGAKIGYGHAKTLTSTSPFVHPSNPEGSDLLAFKPTIMVAVPAILDLIKKGLTLKLQKMEGFKGKLVRGSISMAQGGGAGGEGLLVGVLLSLGLSGVLIKKVKQQLGLERLRIIGSGGAPLAAETQEFITKVLAPVAQGYGATETTGASTVQEVVSAGGRPADLTAGKVGPVQPSCEIKLKSVPDMGYLVTDNPPRGEILLGGNSVSQQGYFKMPDKSKEDFPTHADGRVWFHTGDIGVMTESGSLKIIDRKKDLVKLAAGEYVSLGKVEAALKQVAGVGACVVFAQSNKDHCVCIVSQPERGWASVGGKPEEAELVKNMEQSLRQQGLARFEIPTKVKLDDLVWTPENGLTTASMKVQRNPLRNHYNGKGGLLEQMDYGFK
eukprot:TRINITY_DN37568_c0_g1_i1.p1 TRINITY_DN37568_c0_g1~~TRINITY_DN37568_c0_g1_i1.p1  ORF type:complete len:732 (+),score=166.56 TRINITY_DN37568_c0_g1_i1:63-2198(+)